MPDRVNVEWANLRQLQGLLVLELHAIGIDVLVFCFCGPHPTLTWFFGEFPAVLQDTADSWAKRKDPPRCFGLALRNQEHSVPARIPVDVLPFEAVTFFRAHARVEKDHGNIMQERQSCREV